MGFRDLFKVRQPGHGDKVQKSLTSPKKGPSISSKNSSQNSSGKTLVK